MFQDPKKKWSFVIVRSVKAVVGSKADHDRLKPSAPYTRRRAPPWRKSGSYIPGVRPAAWDAIPYVRKLTQSPIPAEYEVLLGRKDPASAIAQLFRQKYLPSTLNAIVHSKHFRALLWVEEFAQE